MRIGVLGAGAIGGYVGVRLAAAGAETVLVGRRPMVEQAASLVAIDVQGHAHRPHARVEATDDVRARAEGDACLVTVKSRDTAEAGRELDGVLAPGCVVVSLQNGLENARVLRSHLGAREVLAGIVGYNVVRESPVRFRQASSGKLIIERGGARARELSRWLRRAGQHVEARRDVERILAGKLLLNLNNGIGAATGLGIAASLRDADARWCFAECLREGARVMRRAGIRPARVAPLGPRTIAAALALPNAIVLRMARALIAVDEAARSSTLQDLERGKPTEIDELNGAVVRIAERDGRDAPINRSITELVHAREDEAARGEPLRFVAPSALRRDIERLRSGRGR